MGTPKGSKKMSPYSLHYEVLYDTPLAGTCNCLSLSPSANYEKQLLTARLRTVATVEDVDLAETNSYMTHKGLPLRRKS